MTVLARCPRGDRIGSLSGPTSRSPTAVDRPSAATWVLVAAIAALGTIALHADAVLLCAGLAAGATPVAILSIDRRSPA